MLAEGETGEEHKENIKNVNKTSKVKSNEKNLSNFEFELILSDEKKLLTVQTRDVVSKRLFGRTFSHKDLVDCNFHPKYSVEQTCELIEKAITGTHSKVPAKLFVGYVNGDKQETKDIRNEYRRGDRIQIHIAHELDCPLQYELALKEIPQSDVKILEERIKDLSNENQKLLGELTTIKAQVQAEAKKLLEPLQGEMKKDLEKWKQTSQTEAKKDCEKLQGEIKNIEKLHTTAHSEIKKEIEQKIKKLEIGYWTSATNNGNYRLWNAEVLNTCKDAFELQNNQKDVVVKKAGIYRIQANVGTYGVTTKYATLYVNNAIVRYSYAHTSQTTEHQSVALNYVAKLEVNTLICIQTVNGYDYAPANSLCIERLGD